jgi:pentatricopeptide repeat protein
MCSSADRLVASCKRFETCIQNVGRLRVLGVSLGFKMEPQYVVSWNAMELGHVKCGQGQKAMELIRQMQQESV